MKPKKRIAFYLGSLAQGGAERVVVNLSDYFVKNGYEVIIVTKLRDEPEYTPDPCVTRILADLTKEEMHNNRILDFYGRVRKLRSIWKRIKPQVIISFIGKNNIMSLLSSRFLNIPVILSVRSAPEREYPKGPARILAKLLFGMGDGIILQTPDAKGFFPKKIQKKAVILPNSLNPQFIKKRYEGIRVDEIVSVGRLDQNKNQKMLVDAFAPLHGKYPQTKVILYGDGEARPLLEEKIREKCLEDTILLAGAQKDICNKIYKSRIFVLSSTIEGMPNALIEAMSLGLAVIATDCPCGGPNMLIQNQENGLLIPVGSTQDLTKALDTVLSNPVLEESLGKNAVKIQEEYSPQKVNEAWEEYILSKIK